MIMINIERVYGWVCKLKRETNNDDQLERYPVSVYNNHLKYKVHGCVSKRTEQEKKKQKKKSIKSSIKRISLQASFSDEGHKANSGLHTRELYRV